MALKGAKRQAGVGDAAWGQATPRAVEIALRFGLGAAPAARRRAWPAEAEIEPGRITLVTGPSGSGKSRLLAALAQQRLDAICVNTLPFPLDVTVLDAVAPGKPLAEALGALSACALAEPALWLRRFAELSVGEQFRARLARAVSLVRSDVDGLLLCDEFGSNLHRRVAKAIAYSLRKLSRRTRIAFVLATAHDDLATDLRADTTIRLSAAGEAMLEPPTLTASGPSFATSYRVERGSLQDYAALASMHYRRSPRIGFVDRVFVLRDDGNGEVLGVVLYGHPPLELSLRNVVTGRRFVRNPVRLNREMRILRRLIIHPDVRGCGFGRRLVAETLPHVGTPFVECLATMGLVHPVFEKAGMRRVGICPAPARQRRWLHELRMLGADVASADFVRTVCCHPRARRIVTQAVAAWYRPSVGNAERRAARQTPAALARTFRQIVGSQPVYYLWSRDAASAGAHPQHGGMGPDVTSGQAFRPESVPMVWREGDSARAVCRQRKQRA